MKNSNQSAAHAAAKPQLPIMVSGWTQDPVFQGEHYFHSTKMELEVMYAELMDTIEIGQHGAYGFNAPYQDLEDLIIFGRTFPFDLIEVYLTNCYAKGRISEEKLAGILTALAHQYPIYQEAEYEILG